MVCYFCCFKVYFLSDKIYSIVYPFVKKKFKVNRFILYLYAQFIFFIKNLEYNIIDTIIHPKILTRSFKEVIEKALNDGIKIFCKKFIFCRSTD